MWSDLGSCIFAVSGIGNVRVLPPLSLTRTPDRMVLGNRKSAVAQERQIVIFREAGSLAAICDPGRETEMQQRVKSHGAHLKCMAQLQSLPRRL